MICLLGVLCSLVLIKKAYAPPPPPAIPTYTWSAHGSTSIGVYRSSIAAFGYSKGNCAHCHEQHSSIGGAEPEPASGNTQEYLIFRDLSGDNQGVGYCYWCHTDPTGDTNQQQISMPPQYNYSRIAGGDNTISCPDDINETFKHLSGDCASSRSNWCSSSEGSAHCIENIQDFLKNTPTWNFGAEETVNPCSGCHNPHRAQYDSHNYSSRMTGQKLPGVVSRPSQHSKDNKAWQLWGDDLGERMSDYTSNYQAPCRYLHDPVASPGACEEGYEPDGSPTIANGSNLFDTVTFCLDCHQNSITSTRLGTVDAIDWGAGGDVHGQNTEADTSILKFPYVSGPFVLSCLDCHEPHGSPNEYLLRQTVNGAQVLDITSGNWCYLCTACHAMAGHWNNCDSGTTCDTSYACHRHNGTF